MFNLCEELTKIEILLAKEIEVYKVLLEYEEKKVAAIIDAKLQDVHLYCEYQNKKMSEANGLRELREKSIDIVALNKFPFMSEEATLSDIIKRIPLNKTAKISSMRLELVTLMARLRHLNKLAPKLFEEALDIFSGMRDILEDSRKLGYDNKGKEHMVNRRLTTLVNKQV